MKYELKVSNNDTIIFEKDYLLLAMAKHAAEFLVKTNKGAKAVITLPRGRKIELTAKSGVWVHAEE